MVYRNIQFSEKESIQSISMWHPINGEWVHIVQINEDDKIVYYTDGIKEFA